MIHITTTTKLSVKELAAPLGRSVWFIYKMRQEGFPMDRDEETRCHVSTVAKARRWIKENKFKVVRGRGVRAKDE